MKTKVQEGYQEASLRLKPVEGKRRKQYWREGEDED